MTDSANGTHGITESANVFIVAVGLVLGGPAFTLGAAASVSSPSVITAIAHRMRAEGKAARLLRYVSSIDGVVGILGFGIITLFFFGPSYQIGIDALAGWQWIIFALFLSITIGFLFHMLTIAKLEDSELLAMMIGILVFSAGACFFLNLSPLFVCFLVGIILSNLSTSRERFYRILVLKEKPVYILLLVLVGTLYKVEPEDLVVNITFAWEGAIAFAKEEDSGGLVSHRFPTFRINAEKADIEFVRNLVLTKRFIWDLGLISPGGAGRKRVMNKKDFLKIKVYVPSIKTQKKIGQILLSADNEINHLEKKLKALEKQKRGLMNISSLEKYV